MSKPKLILLVDLQSPLTYMSYILLRDSGLLTQCDFSLVPIYLPGLLKSCGVQPPWGLKNKPDYLVRDAERMAKRFGIPLGKAPVEHPNTSTAYVQRSLCMAAELYPARLQEVFAAYCEEFWVRSRGIYTREAFQPILEKVLGPDQGQEVAQASETELAKKILSANNEFALKEGAFGLPWFIALNKMGEKDVFWGFDHLGMVLDFLGLERPPSRNSKVGRWQSLL